MIDSEWSDDFASVSSSGFQTWFRRRVRLLVFPSKAKNIDPDLGEGARLTFQRIAWAKVWVDLALEWYVDRITDYVSWIDSEEYRGDGYSNGEFRIDSAMIKRDFKEAEAFVDRSRDAERFVTLDDWLRADLEGKLWYKGDIGGTARLPKEMQLARNKCRSCGQRFTPRHKRGRTCNACLESAKQERAAARARIWAEIESRRNNRGK